MAKLSARFIVLIPLSNSSTSDAIDFVKGLEVHLHLIRWSAVEMNDLL